MKHRTLILLLTVLATFSVGTLTGYRARVSEEVVNVYPNGRFLPPIPDDLSVVFP